VEASARAIGTYGETLIEGYLKKWLNIAKLGNLPADITPHVVRRSFANLAADLDASATTSPPSPACSATRRTASPAGTCSPPMPCC
jgi:hypothetical protein